MFCDFSHATMSRTFLACSAGVAYFTTPLPGLRRTVRRPADLGDDDVLVAEVLGLLELGEAALEIFQRRLARLLVPVGQDVDGEIVDLACELGILQPDVPGFGGADRHLDVALDVPDLADQLGRAGGV